MTQLGRRLKALRAELGISQEAIGAQGFVSAPGWIKIENGQRQASEKLIGNLCTWLVRDKHVPVRNVDALQSELLLLKYLDDPSSFIREAVQAWAQTTPRGRRVLEDVRTSAPAPKPKRGRPKTAPAKAKGGAR